MPKLSPKSLEKSNETKPFSDRGQGRRQSPSTKLQRFVINEIVNSGRSPAHIMLRNMWWWDEIAETIGQQLLENSQALKFAKTDEEKYEALQKFNENLETFFKARDKSQSCATDVAPYIHARLQSLKVDATINNVTPRKLAKDAPEEKFIEGYATLVNESYRAADPSLQPEMANADISEDAD